jgi:hypothetical protein
MKFFPGKMIEAITSRRAATSRERSEIDRSGHWRSFYSILFAPTPQSCPAATYHIHLLCGIVPAFCRAVGRAPLHRQHFEPRERRIGRAPPAGHGRGSRSTRPAAGRACADLRHRLDRKPGTRSSAREPGRNRSANRRVQPKRPTAGLARAPNRDNLLRIRLEHDIVEAGVEAGASIKK